MVKFHVHDKPRDAAAIPDAWVVEGTLDELRRYAAVNYGWYNEELPDERGAARTTRDYEIYVFTEPDYQQDGIGAMALYGGAMALYGGGAAGYYACDFIADKASLSALLLRDGKLLRQDDGSIPDGFLGPLRMTRVRFVISLDGNAVVMTRKKTAVRLSASLGEWLSGMTTGKTTRIPVDAADLGAGYAEQGVRGLRAALSKTPYSLVSLSTSAANGYIVDRRDYASARVAEAGDWFVLNPARRLSHPAVADALHLFRAPGYSVGEVRLSVDGGEYALRISASMEFIKWFSGSPSATLESCAYPAGAPAVLYSVWRRRAEKMAAAAKRDGFGSWITFGDTSKTRSVVPDVDGIRGMFQLASGDADFEAALKRTPFSERELRRLSSRHMNRCLFSPDGYDWPDDVKRYVKYVKPDLEYVKSRARRGNPAFLLDYKRIMEARAWLKNMVARYGHMV